MKAPSTFQPMMDCVFQDLPFVRVYLDDVVFLSESLDNHIDYLIQLFEVIATNRLKLKISKCSFALAQTSPLRQVIGKLIVEVGQEKT